MCWYILCTNCFPSLVIPLVSYSFCFAGAKISYYYGLIQICTYITFIEVLNYCIVQRGDHFTFFVGIHTSPSSTMKHWKIHREVPIVYNYLELGFTLYPTYNDAIYMWSLADYYNSKLLADL